MTASLRAVDARRVMGCAHKKGRRPGYSPLGPLETPGALLPTDVDQHSANPTSNRAFGPLAAHATLIRPSGLERPLFCVAGRKSQHVSVQESKNHSQPLERMGAV